jgi:CDP-paratose 2-epimerase
VNRCPTSESYVLITGGAGFIGTNLAKALANDGRSIVVLDNFSRRGVENNAAFLHANYRQHIQIVRGDCRDRQLVNELVSGATHVFHFAAQVAVTTSLEQPALDFDTNARGTLTILEAVRRSPRRPPLLYTSTNKVYGDLGDLALERLGSRYEPLDAAIRARGISEQRPLAFHSPYGCSKGAADQYVLDYAHSYDIATVVFRMSCIYGPHQCGNEDQGWVAHFLSRAVQHQPITIYGDGLQVRDVLNVDDLVRAFKLAMAQAEALSGNAYNIGGGPTNTVSLLELVELIRKQSGSSIDLHFAQSRRGDQRFYVSDTLKFRQHTGWLPLISVPQGIAELGAWLAETLPINPDRTAPGLASRASWTLEARPWE